MHASLLILGLCFLVEVSTIYVELRNVQAL